MKVLLLMKSPGTTRNLESTLEGLALRGHSVHLGFETLVGEDAVELLHQLRSRHPGITSDRAPGRVRDDRWHELRRVLRRGSDYLRYLEPRYAEAHKLRARAARVAPAAVVRAQALPGVRTSIGTRAFSSALRRAERALPAPAAVGAYISRHAPDVVLATPLVGLASPQADYIRAARELGIPTGVPVWSWDNLTNKGLMRDVPDLVAVWNEAQAREAIELHGARPGHIVVTGAVAYDHWFTWTPQRDREEFCAAVGLDPSRPVLLYLCSSPFIAPDEVPFVRRWLAAVRRAADPRVAGAGVIVRPHPQNAAQWTGVALGDDRVRIWPPAGAKAGTVTAAARADYYDSMHHCTAVVGVNTSALIESAIVGRPVLTVLDDDFRDTQEGTLHFRHLSDRQDGVLQVATDLEEHVEQLARVWDEEAEIRARLRRFVERFVRPNGLDLPAGPQLVAAIERLAANPCGPRRPRPGQLVLRAALAAPAAIAARRMERHRAASKAKEKQRAERARRAEQQLQAAQRRERQARQKAARQSAADAAVAAAGERIDALAVHPGPILAGPWHSEVGYELLYWIPFLTWATQRRPELAERLVAVSRGGAAHWYSSVAADYLDLFDQLSPEDLRAQTETAAATGTRGLRKQVAETPLDAQLLASAAARNGLSGWGSLHPALMYRAYWALVKADALPGPDLPLVHRPMSAPPESAVSAELPAEFAAVRFYFSASFPDSAANTAFVRSTVEWLSERLPVVLLDPAMRFDDHWDMQITGSERVLRVDRYMTPRTNLAIQSEVIARSRLFVGTYGGLSYLAPCFGVPSRSFYSEHRFKHHHLDLATAVGRRAGFGSFAAEPVGSGAPDAILDALLEKRITA